MIDRGTEEGKDMAHYSVGSMIRDVRERQNYSQEELSFGICTASTLSRIENGVQVPGKKILEALMQRLGMVDRIYNSYLSREEMECYELEEKLTRCLAREEYAKAEEYADVLENKLKDISGREYSRKLETQYVWFARALICKNRGENSQYILEQLLEAIRVTIPDFDGMHIRTRLLTLHEITILNNIGCIYHAMGKIRDGVRLLFALKEYIEEHTASGEELSAKYLMILQNLSSWLGQEGCYKEALRLCQMGLDHCVEYGKMHMFPMLLCNKACSLAELGHYDVSKESFSQSIAVFQAMSQHDRAEQVRKYAEVHYGILWQQVC